MLKTKLTAVAVAVCVVLPAQVAHAQGPADQVSVSGEGQVPVKPDVMYVHSGVEVHRAKVDDAYQAATRAGDALVQALRGAGVAADDIRTASLSVQPEYAHDAYPKISGYDGTEDIDATVRDLAKADQTLGVVAGAGPDVHLEGVTFDLLNTAPSLAKARALAYADAHAKAEQYARLAGRTLGPLISAEESTVDPIPPQIYTANVVSAAGGHINPGTGETVVHAHLIYALT